MPQGVFAESFKFSPAVQELTLRVFMPEMERAFLHSVEFKNFQDIKFVGFDERYDFEALPSGVFKKQKRAVFPLGVNLEAGYLFNDLNREKRSKLLEQAVFDGFSTVRLHKLYRVFCLDNFNPQLFQELSLFIQEIFALKLDLYLDIISWPPERDGAQEGWKQDFFLLPSLQERAEGWLSALAGLKFDGRPFLQHPQLKWLCLINENSLFFEDNPDSRRLAFRLYAEELQKKKSLQNPGGKENFIGFSGWKQEKMLSVYQLFSELLRHKYGYDGEFFLSNYGAGGQDLAVNKRASGVVDRHFYFDYPDFINGLARVKNLSPVKNREAFRQYFQQLFSEEGGYISEINLPWPNRWQHELIPFILYLHKIKPLRGLWFYDYRLRSAGNFHHGGIFGIQRFRSIIGQLPFLKMAWSEDYTVQEQDGGLFIKGNKFFCFSGILPNGLPVTRWRTEEGEELFTLEKAEGDVFDELNLQQLKPGRVHQQLLMPVEKNYGAHF
jgi:hypothetical protein